MLRYSFIQYDLFGKLLGYSGSDIYTAVNDCTLFKDNIEALFLANLLDCFHNIRKDRLHGGLFLLVHFLLEFCSNLLFFLVCLTGRTALERFFCLLGSCSHIELGLLHLRVSCEKGIGIYIADSGCGNRKHSTECDHTSSHCCYCFIHLHMFLLTRLLIERVLSKHVFILIKEGAGVNGKRGKFLVTIVSHGVLMTVSQSGLIRAASPIPYSFLKPRRKPLP